MDARCRVSSPACRNNDMLAEGRVSQRPFHPRGVPSRSQSPKAPGWLSALLPWGFGLTRPATSDSAIRTASVPRSVSYDPAPAWSAIDLAPGRPGRAGALASNRPGLAKPDQQDAAAGGGVGRMLRPDLRDCGLAPGAPFSPCLTRVDVGTPHPAEQATCRSTLSSSLGRSCTSRYGPRR